MYSNSNDALTMKFLRITLLAILCSLFYGCASTSNTNQPPSSDDRVSETANPIYCDNYLLYRMCASDIDSNGDVDVMYFEDTNEIFMIKEGINPTISDSQLTLHDCVQTMNSSMETLGDQLLMINEDTPALSKVGLKSKLMLQYARYLPKINSCGGNSAGYAMDDSQGEFGDEDFEDL